MSNTELAKLLYENVDIDKNAITIYAKDLKGLFKFGMILRKTSIDIQTITQDYIEYLLENNGLNKNDCLSLLTQ